MKKTTILLVYIFIGILVSCNDKSENINRSKIKSNKINSDRSKILNNDDSEKKWLLNFYKDYINFYINSTNRKDKSKLILFFKQLDSIKKENCTVLFYKLQNEDEFVKEFDYITNNEFICEKSLNSLEVVNKNKNIYMVSFIAEYPLNEFESDYKKINFEVSIEKVNGVYKISKTCCF